MATKNPDKFTTNVSIWKSTRDIIETIKQYHSFRGRIINMNTQIVHEAVILLRETLKQESEAKQ